MPYESLQNSIITTSSGVVGGVTKAIASGFTVNSVTIFQLADVSIYAAVSAIVGYTVKYIYQLTIFFVSKVLPSIKML